MIYITGDTHREFSRLDNFNYQKKDVLIILGDAGINYFLNHFDDVVKERLNKLVWSCTLKSVLFPSVKDSAATTSKSQLTASATKLS